MPSRRTRFPDFCDFQLISCPSTAATPSAEYHLPPQPRRLDHRSSRNRIGKRAAIGLSQRLENMCGMFIVSVTSRLGCLSVPGEAHSPLKRMGHRLRLIAGRFRLLGNSLSFYLPVERSRIRLHFELCPSRSRRSVAELQRGISTLLGAQRKYYRVHPRR